MWLTIDAAPRGLVAAIAWDQTLLSLLLAAGLVGLVVRAVSRSLVRQERQRLLRDRRDALEHVLLGIDGTVADYLTGAEPEYPQREMVELERRALQAQVHCLRDLELQKALRDICYPNRHLDAAQTLRAAIAMLERDIEAAR